METTWKIDPTHSDIAFKVKHMMITNVTGTFGSFRANAKTDGEDFNNAEFEFEADVESINTGTKDRDEHLMSDDFFNAEEFPLIGFKSTNVEVDGEDLKVDGILTIRDHSKPVTLKGEFAGIVTDPYGQTKAGLTLSGKIKRSEFGLKWNAMTDAGNVVVSDTIHINNEMQFIKE